MTQEVIHVGLYGGKGLFGGKETPLEASVISCDKHDQCSYYQQGQCLKVRQMFSSGCRFGRVQTIKGYTSRAKKYGQFKREWQDHERYAKLSHPPMKLGIIDGLVVFPYSSVRIEKNDNGNWQVKDPTFSNSNAYIDEGDFTPDLIRRICMYRPQAIMGGEIRSYQKETVPLFLAHLEEVLPEKYDAFIREYPTFSKKKDYVGRKALLTTLNPSTVYYKSQNYPNLNEEWEWDGHSLTYQAGRVSSFNVTKDYEIESIVLKPSDKSVVTITSNEQVNKQTVFID